MLAAVLHLAVLPFYAASGLVAPGWAVAGLLVLWALLAGVLVAVGRRRGAPALVVPVVAVVLWFVLVTLGAPRLDRLSVPGWPAEPRPVRRRSAARGNHVRPRTRPTSMTHAGPEPSCHGVGMYPAGSGTHR